MMYSTCSQNSQGSGLLEFSNVFINKLGRYLTLGSKVVLGAL